MKHSRYAWAAVLVFLTVPVAFAHGPASGQPNVALDAAAIGAVHFENSCSPPVQPIFNRGIALLHSFWFGEAIKTFDEVLAADPKCALAEWGKAMAYWGNPLGNNRAKAWLELGAEAVQRARKLPTRDDRERGYIDAIGALYEDFENTLDHARAVAFEKAMEQLVANYPDDREAAIFFAMALNGSADLNDKTYAQPLRAAKILEAEFEKQPQHPGIAHYLIHSYDVPSLAMHALPAARQYADIAPAAPHALHMPSHTFTRLGHWQESIATNLRSADAALAAGSPAEALHAIDYMVYAYLQTGQDAAAAAALTRSAEVFAQVADTDPYIVAGAFAAAAVPTRIALERGDWAAAKKVAAIKSPAPFIDAIIHFAHGLGAARTQDLVGARSAISQLQAAEAKLSNNAYWAGRVAIQRALVEAWLLLAEQAPDKALMRMQEALVLEDASEKSAISPGPFAPTSEQLGDMLMQLDRPSEALTAYAAAIDREPGRFRGLYGGALAAAASGNAILARVYFSQLIEICSKADAERPELRHALSYMQQASN